MTKEKNDTAHIFDDVFRTMEEHIPQLVIPLINEVFGTSYPSDTKVTRLAGRHHRMGQSNEMDSSLGIEDKAYHFECESNPGRKIIIVRLLEYDLSEALDKPTQENGVYVFQMPRTCLIYLRHNSKTKNTEKAILRMADDREIEYTVPVIKCQEYSKEQIFEKKLYMFLLYYILRYEKQLAHQPEEVLKKELRDEYEDILNRMEQKLLPEQPEVYLDLYQLMEQVQDYVLRKNSVLKEGVKHIMGGKAMELYSQQLLREGHAEGHAEGRQEGRLSSLLELVKDGLLDLITAAERAEMTVEKFKALLEEKQ